MGEIRRALSCAFVRAQALCLLARLGQLGPGARAIADRRILAQRQKSKRKRDAKAVWSVHVRGRGLSTVGMLFRC